MVKKAEEDPSIIIRDKKTLHEMYPELDIEDMPVPLYWGCHQHGLYLPCSSQAKERAVI